MTYPSPFIRLHGGNRRCGFGSPVFLDRRRSLIPGRLQSVSEMAYEFVANTLRDAAGTSGMKFFPFVFSLFMFVLVANLFGMIRTFSP